MPTKQQILSFSEFVVLTLLISSCDISNRLFIGPSPTPSATMAPSKTPLSTSTLSVVPTPMPTITIAPYVQEFRQVNVRTGVEENLSLEAGRLRRETEALLLRLNWPRNSIGFAINHGDPDNPVFVYIFGGSGTLASRATPLGGGRFELISIDNPIYFLMRTTGFQRKQILQMTFRLGKSESMSMVYNVLVHRLESVDRSGQVLDSLPLPSLPDPSPDCDPGSQQDFIHTPQLMGGTVSELVRLYVLNSCIRVTGIVFSISQQGEADGDFTFEVALDPPFQKYLTDANRQFWKGNMHVEIVCHDPNSRNESAKVTCANFPEALRVVPPRAGQRVWLEGQWVLDMGHDGWAEIHPLYRWGLVQ